MVVTKQQFINSLAYILNGSPSARWNFPLSVGSDQDSPVGTGQPAKVTYGFLSSLPVEYSAEYPGFQVLTETYRSVTHMAFRAIAAVCNLQFVNDSHGASAQIRIGLSDQSASPTGQAAYAYTPSYSWKWSGADNTITEVNEIAEGGDIWINSEISYTPADLQVGGSLFETLMHELGHAVGLKHSFEDGLVLPKDYDNTRFTMMSYTSPERTDVVSFSVENDTIRASYSEVGLSTPMVGDIAALQALYGRNYSTNAGNTRYGFAENDAAFRKTIWDGSGIDMIDCRQMRTRCIISLIPGGYSSIGLRQSDKEMELLYKVPNEWPEFKKLKAWSNLYNGSNNLGIAYDCLIENGYGGAGNDTLIGNYARNQLFGGPGNDVINAGAGNDYIVGGQGADRLSGSSGSDSFVYPSLQASGVGSGKRDVINDFNITEGDKLVFSSIDADPASPGRQAFVYIGRESFTGAPGEIRFSQGLLQINTDGDTTANIEVQLSMVNELPFDCIVV